MELNVDKVDTVTVVAVKSDHLDAGNSREFKEKMNELLPAVKNLLLDLQAVDFIDSTGLAALLMCLKQLSVCGGDMKVCQISSSVRALFDLVKINRIVEVCRTRADGLSAFARSTPAKLQ